MNNIKLSLLMVSEVGRGLVENNVSFLFIIYLQLINVP
jgi:hypothetical protein